MEQNSEYLRAVEVLKKLEYSLAAINVLSSKNYADSRKAIEDYFTRCFIALEARRAALIATVEERLQTQKKRVADQQTVLRDLISSYNKIIGKASKNYTTNKDASLELLKSAKMLGQSQAIDDVPSFAVNFTSDICDAINKAGIVQDFHPLAGSGKVNTIAGKSGSSGYENKKGIDARMNHITGLCLNPTDGRLYFSDCTNKVIRKVSPEGEVSHFAGDPSSGPFKVPYGIAYYKKGNVFYVADKELHVIHRITHNGVIDVFAGSPGNQGKTDGEGGEARFNNPVGVAVDQDTGEVYVSDKENNIIRVINQDKRMVTTVAGSGVQGRKDGRGTNASFDKPAQIYFCHSLQTLFVCEYGSNQIRPFNTKSKEVTTLPTSGCSINDRSGITVLPNNAVLLTGNNHIFHFALHNGTWVRTILAGNGTNNGEDGPAEHCSLSPVAIALDEKSKCCFVAESYAIRKLSFENVGAFESL